MRNWYMALRSEFSVLATVLNRLHSGECVAVRWAELVVLTSQVCMLLLMYACANSGSTTMQLCIAGHLPCFLTPMLPLPHSTTLGMKRCKHTRTVTQQQTQQYETPNCPTLIFDHKLNQRSHASVVQGMLYLQVIRATSTGRLYQGLQASRAPGGVDGQLGALATWAAWVGMAVMISPLLPHLISLNKLWQWA